jgi:hypothetical protein
VYTLSFIDDPHQRAQNEVLGRLGTQPGILASFGDTRTDIAKHTNSCSLSNRSRRFIGIGFVVSILAVALLIVPINRFCFCSDVWFRLFQEQRKECEHHVPKLGVFDESKTTKSGMFFESDSSMD